MSKDSIVLFREEIKKWYDLLAKEPSIAGDGIDLVKNDLSRMIGDMNKAPVVQQGLTFAEIKIGETYLLAPSPQTKSYLHNVPVKITDKKIKNVTGTLERGAGNYKAGTKFTIPPSSLIRP